MGWINRWILPRKLPVFSARTDTVDGAVSLSSTAIKNAHPKLAAPSSPSFSSSPSSSFSRNGHCRRRHRCLSNRLQPRARCTSRHRRLQQLLIGTSAAAATASSISNRVEMEDLGGWNSSESPNYPLTRSPVPRRARFCRRHLFMPCAMHTYLQERKTRLGGWPEGAGQIMPDEW